MLLALLLRGCEDVELLLEAYSQEVAASVTRLELVREEIENAEVYYKAEDVVLLCWSQN